VFVALQGEQADGHDYLTQALRQGASGVVVSDLERFTTFKDSDGFPEMIQPGSLVFVLHVNDALQALQAIARGCRQKHTIPVIGITGSNGKTTVKDMTASVLSTQFQVLKSHKSFNNHIGLPLTLANMSEQHEVAVLEMGMNAPGELTHLAEIARPDIGMITNIAPAHFGFFHSLEAIMQAKMELITSLASEGFAILNADDGLFATMRQQVPCRLLTFGMSKHQEKPTISARNLQVGQDGAYTFELSTPAGIVPITLPVPGRHTVQNALAAAAAVYAVSQLQQHERVVSRYASFSMLEVIQQGIEQFCPSPMRMQKMSYNGVTIINDAYNANPNSMAVALQTLKNLACSGKKLAVLGDMFELGEISVSAHYEVGRLAAEVPVSKLFVMGEYAQDMVRGAREAGVPASDILVGDSHTALAEALRHSAVAGDVVLVKASRGMTMERMLDEYMHGSSQV
jgi:UDP-N-acetylmuramoyl-tripeptide--D-alanyl-D-alanine ligase